MPMEALMDNILLLSSTLPNFKIVKAVFDGSTNEYSYKTTLPVTAGDCCVVVTPSGVKVVKITEVTRLTSDSQLPSHAKLKWLVQQIDFGHYTEMLEYDKGLQKKIDEIEVCKRRSSILEDLGLTAAELTIEAVKRL